VLNYRRPEETASCVKALLDSVPPPASVIVVDNDSGDGSADWLRSALPHAEIVESGKNLGYAGGMNVGMRRALRTEAAYILVLNGDTLVDPGTMASLVSGLERDPSAGAATGTFYYHPETTRIWYAGGELAWWRANAVTRRSLPAGDGRRSGETYRVSFVTGCAILFRAATLRTAGLFDERFFMYQEDAELCARFITRGHRLLYVPHAALYHKMTVDEETPLKVYFTMRNRLLLLESAPDLWARSAGTAFYLAMAFLKIVRWALSDRALFRAAYLGILDYTRRRFHEGRGLMVNPQKTPG
jgi:GT2 family glycosyltransferase